MDYINNKLLILFVMFFLEIYHIINFVPFFDTIKFTLETIIKIIKIKK